jgi:hypothetical protein
MDGTHSSALLQLLKAIETKIKLGLFFGIENCLKLSQNLNT